MQTSNFISHLQWKQRDLTHDLDLDAELVPSGCGLSINLRWQVVISRSSN